MISDLSWRSHFKQIVIIGIFVLAVIHYVEAGTSCKPIYDPHWPGLEECVVSVDLQTIPAKPPAPQKMSLWCWAASLSMIYTLQGHPISQDNIVLQNYGVLANAPGGDFLTFVNRMNRKYSDDNGQEFTSKATLIKTPAEAAAALNNDIPLLYSTSNHATVQIALKYQQVPGGPLAFKGGRIWDPASGSYRNLEQIDVVKYVAAWAIETK